MIMETWQKDGLHKTVFKVQGKDVKFNSKIYFYENTDVKKGKLAEETILTNKYDKTRTVPAGNWVEFNSKDQLEKYYQ